MSDSESERQRKLKAGRAKLMEFKQMKKRKKKEEAAAASAASASAHSSVKSSRSASESIKKEISKATSNETSQATGDQDTENDGVSLSSRTGSQAASPIPHDGTDNSYTSGSEYTSGDESYSTDDGGVDSYVIANLERNELKSKVIELEENLRGKQAVLKELNKENFELRAKLHNFESGSRQESSPSPVLKRELDSLQDTLRANQKKLEEMNVENQEMRAKLSQTGHEDDKSVSSKFEELKGSLESKQQMLEALNAQNEQLARENQKLKSRTRDMSPDSSHSDSQIESLQENLKTKQSILTELNRQNQELREKLNQPTGISSDQVEKYERKVSDLTSELDLKNDELEKLKAVQVSFLQTKEVLKQVTLQSQNDREELEVSQKKYFDLQKESQEKQNELLTRATQYENQLEKLQTEYHDIVAINNDSLMKIQILESQITNINDELEKRDTKIEEMDTQVMLAVGQRDAVQLEAKTQVEDFEERVKEMQDQLKMNDAAIGEYESRISTASEELVKTKNLITDSENILEKKDQEISFLQKKVETLHGNDELLAKDRATYQEQIQSMENEIEKKQNELRSVQDEIEKLKGEYVGVIQGKDNEIEELKNRNSIDEERFSLEMKNLEQKYADAIKNQAESEELFKFEKQKWQTEMNDKLVETENENNSKIEELRETLIGDIRKESGDESEMKLRALEETYVSKYDQQNAEIEEGKAKISELEESLSEKEEYSKKVSEDSEKQNLYNEEIKKDLEAKISELEESLSDKEEYLKTVSEDLEKQNLYYEEVNNNFEANKTKISEIDKLLKNKEDSLEKLTEDLKNETMYKEEVKNELHKSKATVSKLEHLLEENRSISKLEMEKLDADLQEKSSKLEDLEHLLSEKSTSLDTTLEELEESKRKNYGMEEEIKISKDGFIQEKLEYERVNEEKLLASESELQSHRRSLEDKASGDVKLQEEYAILKEKLQASESELQSHRRSLEDRQFEEVKLQEEYAILKEKLQASESELQSHKRSLEDRQSEEVKLQEEYAILKEKLQASESELQSHRRSLEDRQSEEVKLQEEYTKLKEEFEEKISLESSLKEQVDSLEEKNKIVSREKEDLLEELGNFNKQKEDFERNSEEKIDENSKLRTDIEELEADRKKLVSQNSELLKSLEDKEKIAEEKINNERNLKEEFSRLQNEKNEVCLEYDAEIRLLRGRLDLVTQEQNAETVALFNQNLVKVEQEKNEQVQNLKEEISHLKESFDKQLHKLQSDYELDSKLIEEENQRLKMEVRELKESTDRDKTSLENAAKIEVEGMTEQLKLELEKIKEELSRNFEEVKLKLKEEYWNEMKKFETEKENEMKVVLEDIEKSKNEALELLRQEIEEKKHKEVHDVVCNMTKENKENAALLREKLEEQLRQVQAQKDEELKNIQEEYQYYKQSKKDEIEDMFSSQIVKYEEERSMLQKRLNEAEEHIHMLSNERDEMKKDLGRKDAVIEEERKKLSSVEENLCSLREENNKLKKTFEATVTELRSLDVEQKKSVVDEEDEVDAIGLVEEKLQGSADDNKLYEESERLLDEELKKVTTLCKQQVEELQEKLNIATVRAEENERKFDVSARLNEALSRDMKTLENELDVSRQELQDTVDLNESLTEKTNFLNAEMKTLQTSEVGGSVVNKETDSNLEKMSDEIIALSAEIEFKKKQKVELDESLDETKSQIEILKQKSNEKLVVVEEDIVVSSAPQEEALIVPEVLGELEVTPLSMESDFEEQQPSSERDIEMKHLQNMLVENNKKLESQKQEIARLHDALESERALFAEQLRARQAKEAELKSSNGEMANEIALREKRDQKNKIMILEQRVKEREQAESELRDENWKLVNLLKDNNIEMFTEKDMLQEQLIKQEEIIQELQLQMSTSDLVTSEIQEAFGRQLAALHRQRDALIDQLEQHKNDHQGYAKIVQEKAALEDRLREEKLLLSEKLKQKEALEMELATERAVLHEKIVELEKLRENMIGKEKLAVELTEQRDDLKMELDAIDERLRTKEENLVIERKELERELQLKEFELQKWEEDFKSREVEFMQNEESLRQNFDEVLESTRTNLEKRYEESLGQLRSDLDSDYLDRMHVLENGLHGEYGEQISRLKDEHQEQINRAKSGFEERLLDLRRQLEEERLRQVGTVKTVLEREHSREIMDLETGHSSEVEEVREELNHQHQLDIERLKQSFQASHQDAIEDLQSSMLSESAIQLAAAKLQAEIDAAAKIEELQAEINDRVDQKIKQMQLKEKKKVDRKTSKDRMDDVIHEMKLKHHGGIMEDKIDTTEHLHEQITALEQQLVSRHNEELRQAEIDLAARYDQEMDRLKYEITQRHGEDMFVVMSEFEAEQENYFKERLHYIQADHENEMGLLSKEHELLLLKTQNELDVLREEDFQRIRRLQDEIYAKEEMVLELRIANDDMQRLIGDGVERKDEKIVTNVLNQAADSSIVDNDEIAELKERLEKALMDNEMIEKDFERKVNEELKRILDEKDIYRLDNKELSDLKERLKKALMEKEMLERENQEIRNISNEKEKLIMENENEICDFKMQLDEALKEKGMLETENHEIKNTLNEKGTLITEGLKEISNLKMLLENAMYDKEIFEKDFERRLDDNIKGIYNNTNEKEIWQIEHGREISDLRANFEKQLIEQNCEHEERYQELRSKYELEISRKDVDYIKKEEEVKLEVEQRQWARNEDVKSEAENSEELHAEQLRELDEKHRNELEEAVVQLSANLKDDFNTIVFEMKSKYEKEQEEIRREFAEDKDTELRLLRSQLYFEMDNKISTTRQECEQQKLAEIAQVTTQLSMKNAVELENQREAISKKYQQELDAVKEEMHGDFSRNAYRQGGVIEDLEMKHAEELRHAKHNYDKLMQERTQELQTEVNLLKSLLEGSETPIIAVTEDIVDAGIPDEPDGSRSVDQRRRSDESEVFHAPGVQSLDVEDNATLASSTETLIARFADGHVENALRDVQDVASSGGGSRYSGSFGGSAPNLFPSSGHDVPWGGEGEHDDQVRREQDNRLSEMRRQFGGSGSDSSSKSIDQMVEAPLIEEEERVNRLLREKDEEMRMYLMKQKEEYDRAYIGRIQELERECSQFENFVHALNDRHQHEINALKNESLRLAEEKIREVREESTKEKDELLLTEHEKFNESKIDLVGKNEKLLEKFVKQQNKEMEELRGDHIEELQMLKHELNSKHEKQLKELSEKQGKYVLETRERYEKLLKEEREKNEKRHVEDVKKLKQAMDHDLGDKQKAMVKLVQEQYESDLKHTRETLESDNRKFIDDLTKDHMVEMERAKETLRRELTDKFSRELDLISEHSRRESETEHFHNLRILEDKLEETHIQQLQTLQDIKEKHKLTIEEMKRDHQKEIENSEKENEEKLKMLKSELQGEHSEQINAVDLSAVSEVEKARKELEEAHKNELEGLNSELTVAKSRIVALEAMKSGTETTYMDTIHSLQEDYENEISKLKGTVEKIKQNQINNLDRSHIDVHNTDQRIIKQNFEQQLSQMKQHYELLMDEMSRNFEQRKRDALQEHVKKYEDKIVNLTALYEEDRRMLTDGIAQLGEEHLKELNEEKDKIRNLKSENEKIEKKYKELRDENVGLGNKARVTDDQYNTLVARHERQEEENTKYISMLSSDVEKCEQAKSNFKRINDRLLQLLSDAVRASMVTEESINRNLDELIQETSKTESGVDISGFRGGARSSRHHPDGDHSFRSFKGSRKSPKKDKTLNGIGSPDITQYSNLSGSLLSDEGLELSFLSRDNIFQGPDIDQNTEDMIRGVGERLHFAVDHVLKMLSMSTKQTTETRQSVDEMLARSTQSEQDQREKREKIAEELKKALEDFEKEKKLKENWEKDARKKHSDHEAMKKENADLKKKNESLEKEGKEKDNTLRNIEEKCLELETEKELLGKLKHELELKLAEVRTHFEKDSHGVRQENEDLKARLARAVQLSGDEFQEVVAEIENLKENIHVLCLDKEALKSQLKDAKDKLSDTGGENDNLRENISEILQINIELIQQNEGLKGKISSLESALEETLIEQKISPQKAAEVTTLDQDFVDGFLDIDGASKSNVSALKDENTSLKECVDFLKQENDNLCNNLEEKVENELELINKVSELENELYKSANEGFESYDSNSLLRQKKNMETKLKKLKAENDRMAEELAVERENVKSLENDLSKASELVSDRNSLYDELMKFKSLIVDKDEEASKAKHDAEVVSLALSDKDEELSVISSEVSELKDTVADQQHTINEQHSKIVSLLQKQASDELNEQYINQLQQEIEREKDMLLEKDGEIEILLQRLSEQEDQGYAEEELSKSQNINKDLENEVNKQHAEIATLTAALQTAEQERERSEQVHEINLQKALHHVKKEMEHANRLRIAKLKEEHQAEMDRVLEMSKLDYSDLGQRFEEQVGAAERVNLQILEQFFRDREMNESQAIVAGDSNAPVQSLLNDLQSEAEKIAQLVTSYETASNESANIEELQQAWSKEKQVLLEAVKALRELVARASHTAAIESNDAGQDWRARLLESIEEVFRHEQQLLNAELETVGSIPGRKYESAEAVFQKKEQQAKQDDFYKKVMQSLDNKDRESLVDEIVHLQRMVKDLQTSVDEHKYVLNEFQAKVEMRETNFTRQLESQASLVEQEKTSSSQLRTLLETEKNRSAELENLVQEERAILAEMKAALASDDEKINDLIASLENERKELNELRATLGKEQLRCGELAEQLSSEKLRSFELQDTLEAERKELEAVREQLETERKQLEDLAVNESSNVKELEKLLSEETEKGQHHVEMINDLTEERNRLEQATEMERNHTKRIEELCEELKTKAAHEKSERQRLEKIAERYHGNLEEMSQLFESEKQRRLENERLVDEQKKHRIEAEEKGQTDEMEKEKLEESLKNAKNNADVLKNELERANQKLTEIQSENVIKIAETEKQNAERIREVLEKAKRNAADEIERERATCVQLREALKSLQLKYETSRSQLERMKDSQERESIQSDKEAKARTSPTSKYSVSSRVMEPFVNRCTKLIVHCQDVNKSEQQRMKYGADRPSSRHIKELQSMNDALAALSHELSDLQQDLRALEQGDHTSSSPLARLEQAHNKNEELRDHIRKLVSEKSELRNTLKSLEEQVMQYRNREAELEEAAKYASQEASAKLRSEQFKWQAEREAIEQALKMAAVENENLRNGQFMAEEQNMKIEEGSKLSESGWTLQKIQKLYGRCLRAESFRKALIYQKKYLLFLLGGFQETEAITLSMIAKMDGNADRNGKSQYGKSRAFLRFRTAARVVIATWRMKFLVKKWSKSVSKAGGKTGGRRSADSKTSPSAPPETISEKVVSSDRFYYPKQNSLGVSNGDITSDARSGDSHRSKSSYKSTDAQRRSRDVNSNLRKHSRHNGHETKVKPVKENGHGTRKDNLPTTKEINDYPSYSTVRNLDLSPPRAYPRPTSPRLNRDSPPVLDTDYGHITQRSSRGRSPMSQGSNQRGIESPGKHRRSLSASGLEETNTSLNAYIKKLESLQARLKSQQ